MGLWDLAAGLRRRQERFFDLLERQAMIASDAAKGLAMLSAGSPAGDVCERVRAHEHEGGRLVHEIEGSLAKAYFTPIDREDIHALALETDDVIDLIHRAAVRCELMQLTAPTPTMTAMMAVLVETTAVLAQAVPMLRRRDYGGILAAKDHVGRLAKEGDRVYSGAVRGIFVPDGADMTTLLRDRAVLDDLDRALDHCGIVLQTLSSLAVKHR